MSTLPLTSESSKTPNDAPRVERTVRLDMASPKPVARKSEALDVPADDLYDNVACTD